MWSGLLDVLFPPQCGSCANAGSGFCDLCARDLHEHSERRETLVVRALGSYSGGLRRAILAIKSGRRDVAVALGSRLGALIPAGSALVPVPTTHARRRARGMDGAYEIARAAARVPPANVWRVLAHAANDTQRGRSREARLRARGRFTCAATLSGEHVVLLDDVCTTGATLEDCAGVLRGAGATVQEAFVIALSPGG